MKLSGWLHSLAQDLRYGLRLLRLNPGFTAIVVLSLALGTGANTAIFQLIDSLRLRALSVAHPEQLANVRILDRSWNSGRVHGRYADITNAQWEQIRDHQRVFSGMFAWATEGGFNLARGGEARYASGIWVSGDFFKTLEVPALRGRTLTADDDRRGCGSPPAVISYAFWQREYAGGPDILGRMISLEGHPFEIVGITPPSFTGIDVGRQFDVAVPLCSEALIHGELSLIDLRNGYWLAAVGRLRPGVTIEQANAEMAALSDGHPGRDHTPAIRCGGAKALPVVQVRRISGSRGILESAPALRDTPVDALGHRRPGLADCLRQYRYSVAGARQRPWARDRRAAFARCIPRAAHPATARGKSFDRCCRHRFGRSPGAMGQPFPGWPSSPRARPMSSSILIRIGSCSPSPWASRC